MNWRSFFTILVSFIIVMIIFSRERTSTPLLDEQAKKAKRGGTLSLSSTSSPATPSRSPAASIKPLRLLQIERCLDGGCDFPDTDPRAYALAVNRRLADELKQMGEEWERAQDYFDSYLPLIQSYLLYQDGFVQEAALELLSRTHPSDDSFELLLKIIQDSNDPHIAKQTLQELMKYRSDLHKVSSIKEMLFSRLLSGSISVKQVYADSLVNFSSLEDYDRLGKIRDNFPIGTPLYLSIGSAIERLRN